MALVVGLTLVIYWELVVYLLPPEGGARSEFGALFGGASALFSALAFVGLLDALSVQRKQLDAQTEDLRQTRLTFAVQSAETTFFQLLHLHNENVKSLA